MVIVDCLTDNNNRTITDVRNCFTKTSSKIGAPGAVAHMFDHAAVFGFAGDNVLAFFLIKVGCTFDRQVVGFGLTDVESTDGKITVIAPNTEFFKVKTALQDAFPTLDIEVEEITFLPQVDAPLTEEDMPMFQKFMDMLEDCDDVQNVYHNAVLPS